MTAARATLLLDASGAQCAAAVLGAEGAILAQAATPIERGRSDRLIEIAEAALADAYGSAPAGFAALARVAAIAGPGSFMGVRVGVAAARGYAAALGLPALGVDATWAIARRVTARRAVVVAFGRAPRLAWRRFDGDAAGPLRAGDLDALRADASGASIAGPAAASLFADAAARAVLDRADARAADAIPPQAILEEAARMIGEAAPGVGPPSPIYARPPDAEPPRAEPPPRLDASHGG